jgi:hypothetical protein
VRAATPAVLLAVVALLAACGGGGGSTTRDARTAVAITVWPQGQGKGPAVTAQLVCDPVSGSLPDPARACAVLADAKGRTALEPTPANAMCTELWGGPAEARIVGSLDGEPVDARLSRANGCEIARWEALSAVLPPTDLPL